MPKLPSARSLGFWGRYEEHRHLGLPFPMGFRDSMAHNVYSSMKTCTTWDTATKHEGLYGGIFNLEFSPDGSLLVAACEQQSVLIFDPLQRKLIRAINNAHADCVNCVRFLDDRLFATCSDDTSVALWDARNMKQKIRVLRGHSNWVKNIEFYKRDGLLVTSGFDGSIYTWDINNYPERGEQYRRVFYTGKLMRTRLVPDMTKLVLCTSSGYIMIIHDLDLDYLDDDLQGFKPNLYRLMQISGTILPLAAAYTHLFHRSRRRNRVELITDFPEDDDAELISSLQIHPQGWCVLSRNSTTSESREWSCVHDIQDQPPSDKDEDEEVKEEEGPAPISPTQDISESPPLPSEDYLADSQLNGPQQEGSSEDRGPRMSLDRELSSSMRVQVTSNEVWEALQTIYEARSRRRNNVPPRNRQTAFILRTAASSPRSVSRMLYIERSGGVTEPARPIPHGHKIHTNRHRLTHYIEEPNLGPGFIKEQCFSPDGRIIVSPYGYGHRILAFNKSCSELSTCVPDKPKQLVEVSHSSSHSSHVLSTRFSPTHQLLVTGCLGGKVVWHQPYF